MLKTNKPKSKGKAVTAESCELGKSWQQDLVVCLPRGARSLAAPALCTGAAGQRWAQQQSCGASHAGDLPSPLFQQPPDC